MKQISNS